jgi:Intracellular proteinase inhibitor
MTISKTPDPGFRVGGSIRSMWICGKKGFALAAAFVLVAASFTIALVLYRWDLGVTLTVDTDKREYGSGDAVKIHLQLKNHGFSTVNLVYGNSITLGIVISDSNGNMLVREPKYALEVITEVALKPGGTLNWGYTWDQVNDTGEHVGPGTYTVLAFSPSSKHAYQTESVFSISG